MKATSLAVPLVGAAVLAVSAVPAGAAHTAAVSKNAKLTISGATKVNIGKSITDTLHFGPQAVQIKSGGTLTIVNKTDPAAKGPHSFSVVKKSQLPRTANQVENCAVCGEIAQAHGADPNSPAPPSKLVVDVGAAGFDQAGDSIFIGSKGSTPIKISAKKGSVLYFLCAVHPWMQGKVLVR